MADYLRNLDLLGQESNAPPEEKSHARDEQDHIRTAGYEVLEHA